MVKRKNNWKVCCIGITTFFYFYAPDCFSQRSQTFTDKKDILIGEQVTLKIKAILPVDKPGLKNWFTIPDSIPHFEIVEARKVDTIVYKDNSKTLEQTITFTSFDSGRWVFPSLAADLILLRDGRPGEKLQTDSIAINVSYSPPDSTNELRDIKPIIQVTVTDHTSYYVAGVIVLLLLMAILFYWYWKKRKKAEPSLVQSTLSAFVEAMQEIKKLAHYNLQNTEEIKLYHSKLSGIFKRYLGRKQNKNLLNKTTGDLLIRMTEGGLTVNHVSNLATALRCTDAVKFAKYLPEVSESEDCLQKIKTIINLIEQQTTNHKP